tara:strand:- start:2735 stop:2938 length:204 start_codon:yes stop_codon:yes gene_type:complete
MKTDFEKYVDDCMEVIKTYTDSLDERKLSLIWKSIENSPERTGKVWLEDILDQTYKERNPDTKYIYD